MDAAPIIMSDYPASLFSAAELSLPPYAHVPESIQQASWTMVYKVPQLSASAWWTSYCNSQHLLSSVLNSTKRSVHPNMAVAAPSGATGVV